MKRDIQKEIENESQRLVEQIGRTREESMIEIDSVKANLTQISTEFNEIQRSFEHLNKSMKILIFNMIVISLNYSGLDHMEQYRE